MLESLLAWVGDWFENGTDSGDDGNNAVADENGEKSEEQDGRFLRSRLDASVCIAHGMGSKAEREMADVEKHAQELEAEQRSVSDRN